jgi:glycosyltransferase involved in cell wall biosynthesis
MSRKSELPLVSCIIAVFNGEAYLHEAIDSVLTQQYPKVEVIVVNDGSTDGTSSIIARYGDRVCAVNQAHAGVSAARNCGVEFSTGELLSFLDADDRLDSRKIATQVAVFAADPQLEFCDCHTSFFWSPEILAEARERDFRHASPFWQEALPGHISGWLFRRQLWRRVGGFSPSMRYSEDTDWFSRACDLPMRRLTLADVLTHRRLHPDNVTARSRDEQISSLSQMFKAHLNRARSRAAD